MRSSPIGVAEPTERSCEERPCSRSSCTGRGALARRRARATARSWRHSPPIDIVPDCEHRGRARPARPVRGASDTRSWLPVPRSSNECGRPATVSRPWHDADRPLIANRCRRAVRSVAADVCTMLASTATSNRWRRQEALDGWRNARTIRDCGALSTSAASRARASPHVGQISPSRAADRVAVSVRARLERRLGLGDGVLRAHLVEDARELALLVDDEGGADDAHELLAVERLLAPHAPRLGDRVVLVGEQREAEPVLVVELLLLRRAGRG